MRYILWFFECDILMNSFALHKTNFQQVWHSPNVNLWHSANRWEPKIAVTRKKFPLLFPAVAVGAQKRN